MSVIGVPDRRLSSHSQLYQPGLPATWAQATKPRPTGRYWWASPASETLKNADTWLSGSMKVAKVPASKPSSVCCTTPRARAANPASKRFGVIRCEMLIGPVSQPSALKWQRRLMLVSPSGGQADQARTPQDTEKPALTLRSARAGL